MAEKERERSSSISVEEEAKWSQPIHETATNYFAVHQSIIDQLILVKLELSRMYECWCMNYFIIG